jgi:cytochrome c556
VPRRTVRDMNIRLPHKENAMLRSGWVAVALLVLGVAAGLSAGGNENPTIEEIMAKAHKTKTGLRDQIAAELKKDAPDWTDVQKKSREFAALIDALGKNEPPMGEKANWKKLTTTYAKHVRELDAAAGKKDRQSVLSMNTKLGTICKSCHDAHRP